MSKIVWHYPESGIYLDQTARGGTSRDYDRLFQRVCSIVLQCNVYRGQPLDSLVMLCWRRGTFLCSAQFLVRYHNGDP